MTDLEFNARKFYERTGENITNTRDVEEYGLYEGIKMCTDLGQFGGSMIYDSNLEINSGTIQGNETVGIFAYNSIMTYENFFVENN